MKFRGERKPVVRYEYTIQGFTAHYSPRYRYWYVDGRDINGTPPFTCKIDGAWDRFIIEYEADIVRHKIAS